MMKSDFETILRGLQKSKDTKCSINYLYHHTHFNCFRMRNDFRTEANVLIYLFASGSFNRAFSVSDNIASYGRVTSELYTLEMVWKEAVMA